MEDGTIPHTAELSRFCFSTMSRARRVLRSTVRARLSALTLPSIRVASQVVVQKRFHDVNCTTDAGSEVRRRPGVDGHETALNPFPNRGGQHAGHCFD